MTITLPTNPKLIGNELNKWREREVFIYADPDDPTMVYTVGKPWGHALHRKDVVTHEPTSDFQRAIAIFPRRRTVD